METRTLKWSSTNSDVKTEVNVIFGLFETQYATAAVSALCPVSAGYRPEPHGKTALHSAAGSGNAFSKEQLDERGFVYVIFPLSALSEALRCSTMSIKRALRSLEDADLIERRRSRIAVPNSLFVKVPTAQKCSSAWNDFVLSDGTEMMPSMEQKCSTNQRNKNDLNGNHLVRTNGTHLMFGEYRNVFLTEKEYKRLKADFSGLDSLIEQLSAYIQSTGRKYADHAATLRIWAKRQKSEQKQAPGIPDYTFKEGESL